MAIWCIIRLPPWTSLILVAVVVSVQPKEEAGPPLQKNIKPDIGHVRSAIRPVPPMSHHYVTRLAEKEEHLYNTLRQLLHSLTHEIDAQLRIDIRRFLEDYEKSSGLVTRATSPAWPSQITQNPLLVLRMIFRFASDLQSIEVEVRKSENAGAVGVLEIFQTLANDGMMPDLNILEDAMSRLLLVMHTYDLAVSDVASGVFQNISTGFNLDRRHCVTLGEFASRLGFHALAVEWVKFALESLQDALTDESKTEMEQVLERLILKHDAEWEEEHPFYPFFMKKIHGAGLQQMSQRSYHDQDQGNVATYFKICGGGNLQSEKIKSELICWYDHKIHPEFRINPLKVELLSKRPLLLQFYDIISKNDAQELIDTGEPHLISSTISRTDVGEKKRYEKNDSGRNSLSIFVSKKVCPASARFLARTHRITKLDPRETPLQLATYTYGGQFKLHHDSMPKPMGSEFGSEHRLSTFMAYLTDVEGGGITAFPSLGIGVKPVAGSGVFWYNLDGNEEPDEKLTHAGCPVILGPPKWIANMVI